ncbi:DegT/DnrJ/EryC1/StrS aminotransferase family protein [Homoserinibacter sp. GY 40078]|uniref:DegT/DnrJ/EryC1/StrS family aminotransferase n=1 Tax=Homoserinibacter sp. GY 40078 TaxID=2603275 RepID=UPI0011C8776B|nr:aminotransferase class I/II-fold pyridoxal phosphate-dependent enzyme [Homoserinibacter sp. GY 40078]TXK16990.1 aminotransferase class I/II-fold pyridoxal phosphate-dependent enzyme [Homoserinibacter sp. GY 40078]
MLVPYTRPALPDFSAVEQLLREAWLAERVANGGPIQTRFEAEAASFFGGASLMAASGTAAIQLAVATLTRGGEVIVPAFTHPATIQAVLRAGARPVAVDIEPNHLSVDPAAVQDAITPATTAIVVTHVFGYPADVESLEKISKGSDIPVIYDAAAAAGTRIGNLPLTHYGDASAVSLHATKVLNGIEGGLLVSRNPCLIDEARMLSNFGIRRGRGADPRGFNAKANELTAAVATISLQQIESEMRARRAVLDLYWERLEGHDTIHMLRPSAELAYNGSNCAVRLDRGSGDIAGAVSSALLKRGIETRRYFAKEYDLGTSSRHVEANRAKAEVICLPLWGQMPSDAIEIVCEALVEEAAAANA